MTDPAQIVQQQLVQNAEPTWAQFLKPFAASMIRHALTVGAGVLVTHGYATSSGAEQVVAGGMALAAAGWSWYTHDGAAKIQQALADAAAIVHQRADQARAARPAAVPPVANNRQTSTGG